MKHYYRIVFAWIAGGWAASKLIPAAAVERGMRGQIGGEWLLIIAAAVAGAWVGNAIYERSCKRGNKKYY